MGTVIDITVASRDEQKAREAISAALDEIERVDRLFGTSDPRSPVGFLNEGAAGERVVVPAEVMEVIAAGDEISRRSGGAFDVTIGPAMRMWRFDSSGRVPGAEEILDSASKVGYRHLNFDKSTCKVGFDRPGMLLDFGAIAKGWAVDQALKRLVDLGIRDAIVDAGGDIRVIGGRPGRGRWRIAVQHPRNAGAYLCSFDVTDTAIVTSGDYERFFVADGVRYHHILDPASGLPARGCQSVTVLAPTAMEADACATAAFVLGPERGVAFLRSRPGVQGLIVDAGGGLHWTSEDLERSARK